MSGKLHSLALLAALVALPAQAAGDGYGLGAKDQLSLDDRSVRIFDDPAFQKRLGEIESIFKADPLAADPDAGKTIRADAAAIAFNALQLIVDGDAERPAAMWSGDAPHRWHDIDVPFASYGLNNPDNIYRIVPIDGASRYEIAGRVAAHRPAQASYFLYNSLPGSGDGPIDEPIDGLRDQDMKIGPDGAFGAATTHRRKLADRVHRGVGNPCSLLLIGLPASLVTFGEPAQVIDALIQEGTPSVD